MTPSLLATFGTKGRETGKVGGRRVEPSGVVRFVVFRAVFDMAVSMTANAMLAPAFFSLTNLSGTTTECLKINRREIAHVCVLLASQKVLISISFPFFDVVTLTHCNVNLFLSRDRESHRASLPEGLAVLDNVLSFNLFYIYTYIFLFYFILYLQKCLRANVCRSLALPVEGV